MIYSIREAFCVAFWCFEFFSLSLFQFLFIKFQYRLHYFTQLLCSLGISWEFTSLSFTSLNMVISFFWVPLDFHWIHSCWRSLPGELFWRSPACALCLVFPCLCVKTCPSRVMVLNHFYSFSRGICNLQEALSYRYGSGADFFSRLVFTAADLAPKELLRVKCYLKNNYCWRMPLKHTAMVK